MSRVYLSRAAGEPLLEYLSRRHTVVLTQDDPRYGPGVEAHTDLRLCKMGLRGPVLFSTEPPRSPAYPDNAAFCAVVLEGFLIHRLDITAPALVQYCRGHGLRAVNVRQGYTRCSCLPVDDRSLITSDPGLYTALREIPALSMLKIREGGVCLPGFETGFFGGAAGRVGDTVVFNGDLSAHPDAPAIRAFIASRGLEVQDFPAYPLTDIGSVIEESSEREILP